MVTSREQCDSSRLQRLLDDQLSKPEETHLIAHLDTCRDCRQQLEQFAAEPDWWDEASQFLPVEVDEERFSGYVGPNHTTYIGLSGDLPLIDFNTDFLEPSDNPAMLGKLGEYEIMEVIGRGGFGVVLKGYDAELNRFVAVKVLAPHLASSAAARRRFSREAQASAAVVHPHVVAIYSVEANAKLPYLVMPLIGGHSLQQRLERDGPLQIQEVLRIGMQTALGLAAAHAQGLVHRDVKPANILLEKDVDRVLITDFGLARAADDASLTRSGFIPGTPQFMSPEQARGDTTDQRSDLFSLGTVLYTLCAGHPPFRAETVMGVLKRICESEPRSICEINADVPPWFARLIQRCLRKDPADRFQSAAELATVFEQCLAHVQQPTICPLPQGLAAPRRSDDRRSRWWWALPTVATLLISSVTLAKLSGFSLGLSSITPRRNPATENNEQATMPPHPSAENDNLPMPVESNTEDWFDTTTSQLMNLQDEIIQLENDVQTD